MYQCLNLPRSICPILPYFFVDGFIMVDTNRIIKRPNIYFGYFLRFIVIWLLITENPVTDRLEYFRKNIQIFLVGTQFGPTNLCLEIVFKVSDMLSSSLLTPPPLPFEIHFIKSDRFFFGMITFKILHTLLDLMIG